MHLFAVVFGKHATKPAHAVLMVMMVNFTFLWSSARPTWHQMANRRLPREGRKDATDSAHAVPLASARQHLGVETQAAYSSERAVEGPLTSKVLNSPFLLVGNDDDPNQFSGTPIMPTDDCDIGCFSCTASPGGCSGGAPYRRTGDEAAAHHRPPHTHHISFTAAPITPQGLWRVDCA